MAKQKSLFGVAKKKRPKKRTKKRARDRRKPIDNLWLPATTRGARYVGDIVLDPTAGSCTTAHACLQQQRRFICINLEKDGIDIGIERCVKFMKSPEYKPQMRRDCAPMGLRVMDWRDCPRLEYDDCKWFDFWLDGNSYFVIGDCIQVMRSMPTGCIDLIYTDPPFNTNQTFRDKETGIGFDDAWAWDDAAEQRYDELKAIAPKVAEVEATITFGWRYAAKESTLPRMDIVLAQIELVKMSDLSMASYLTFVALMLLECHRVLGGVHAETPMPFAMPPTADGELCL